MKKEIFNILFLAIVVVAVAWLYWPQGEEPEKLSKSGADSYVLALSWQPAFCERKPNKPECRSQHERRYDANNFSLHGLWPQPRGNIYCNVEKKMVQLDKRGRWKDLPKLEIEETTRKELAQFMPGYRSNLHRHEWVKHGTCMANNPQRYYEISMDALKFINASALRDLFASNIGKEITAPQIVKAMERSFGKGAGNRITISCKRDGKRTLINEIRISYGSALSHTTSSLEEMNRLAPKLPIGCKRGVVDPVGLQ